MKALLRFAIAALVIAAFQIPANADQIDLTNGLGKFTWGMKRDALLKEAKAAYGAENVTTVMEYAGGYPGDAVIVKQGPVETRFSFSQDQFFEFSRTINAELGGYVTKDDVAKARLAARAKELFFAPDAVTLTAYAQENGSSENRVTAISVTVSAKNVTLEDQIRNDLREKSPSLLDTVIAPLGKP